jgi:Ion channel
MLRQLLVGGAISLANIAIHATVMIALIAAAQRAGTRIDKSRPRRQLIAIMVATVTVLTLAHVAEVAVWAAFYALADVSPPGRSALYFAFVNFATLGYGDIVPTERWLLIGPMTSMNGVMLFGWSTAVMFAIMHSTLVRLNLLSHG